MNSMSIFHKLISSFLFLGFVGFGTDAFHEIAFTPFPTHEYLQYNAKIFMTTITRN